MCLGGVVPVLSFAQSFAEERMSEGFVSSSYELINWSGRPDLCLRHIYVELRSTPEAEESLVISHIDRSADSHKIFIPINQEKVLSSQECKSITITSRLVDPLDVVGDDSRPYCQPGERPEESSCREVPDWILTVNKINKECSADPQGSMREETLSFYPNALILVVQELEPDTGRVEQATICSYRKLEVYLPTHR